MRTPFDAAIEGILRRRYHNHRLEDHSDLVSDALLADLRDSCPAIARDLDDGIVIARKNVSSPGDRERRVDLFIGEPDDDGNPVVSGLRVAVEHKSVVTAHRNAPARFDDLSKVVKALHDARPEGIVIATVLVGTARRYLNVPDRLHPFFRGREDEFEERILPRLSTGDESLFEEFPFAVSTNSPQQPAKTVELLRTLPVRGAAQTHVAGYDGLILVPVHVDNVSAPRVHRSNDLGIDVDAEYHALLGRVCSAYTARWHM